MPGRRPCRRQRQQQQPAAWACMRYPTPTPRRCRCRYCLHFHYCCCWRRLQHSDSDIAPPSQLPQLPQLPPLPSAAFPAPAPAPAAALSLGPLKPSLPRETACAPAPPHSGTCRGGQGGQGGQGNLDTQHAAHSTHSTQYTPARQGRIQRHVHFDVSFGVSNGVPAVSADFCVEPHFQAPSWQVCVGIKALEQGCQSPGPVFHDLRGNAFHLSCWCAWTRIELRYVGDGQLVMTHHIQGLCEILFCLVWKPADDVGGDCHVGHVLCREEEREESER